MTDTPSDPPGQAPEPDAATAPRWQLFFRRAADPLYLLNRRRELLFVNGAWEELTGFPFAAVPRQAVTTGQPLPPRLIVLREQTAQAYGIEHFPAESPAQRRLLEQVRLAGLVDAPVLLVGEAGTGKQWLARTIHRQGKARERTFALVDCARLPAAALPGVLFGEPGLCRRAHVGTVYLREPARLPRELQ